MSYYITRIENRAIKICITAAVAVVDAMPLGAAAAYCCRSLLLQGKSHDGLDPRRIRVCMIV